MKRRSLMIGLVLVITFSSALMIRSASAEYGFYLNEFDPYWDYYASRFIVDSFDEKGFLGLFDYFSWRDYRTWYPEGRDVAATSQGGLQFVGALLFILFRNVFGMGMSLYDFLVLFPVFFGALTVFPTYLLTKKIGGAGAGLIASLTIAFSPPIIVRGGLGWFKSEPLALFLMIFSAYLLLSALDSKTTKISAMWRALLGGLLLGYALTAWGGAQYFNGVVGLLLLISPFLDVDLKRVVQAGSIFVASDLMAASAFPRPGPSIVLNPAGAILLFGLLFSILALYIKGAVDPRDYKKALIPAFLGLVLVGLATMSFGLISGLSGRYMTAIYAFQRTGNPLVESVAEHQLPTGGDFFSSYSLLLFLGIFGAYVLLKKRTVFSAYALILGITSFYVAGSFSRLMVYPSVAIAILAGVGFSQLATTVLRPAAVPVAKKRVGVYGTRPEVKVLYVIFVIFILAYSANFQWASSYGMPTSIAVSALTYNPGFPVPDWLEALTWIRENTPEDAVLASWWDYGYWIAVMGNRTSLADNATINSTRIAQIGRMFMSDEKEALTILKDEFNADYVAVFVAAQELRDPSTGQTFYVLGPGGDEGKKQWFIKIARLNISEYLYEDEFTPKPYFWEHTVLGKMMPFRFSGYAGGEAEYTLGATALYTYELKYPPDGGSAFELAYMSSSLPHSSKLWGRAGNFEVYLVTSVLIYEVGEEPSAG